VVSAGPTFEDIDPVRFVGNRSSGKMGFAIAAAAARQGAHVVLVAGPVALPTPAGVERVDVRSAAQMHGAVMATLPADVYIGAAAVADFTPAQVAPGKIKKRPGDHGLVLELVRTRDILADIAGDRRRPTLVVGFAAETSDVEDHARAKLDKKRLDLICANRVGIAGGGFESDDNALVVLGHGFRRELGPASKSELAGALLDLVAQRLDAAGR
jgi:phosphopantothenoylcysteine decarboxylase/phosphopantothenate--cysteine ligase